MSVKCGSCRGRHSSVQAVKMCYETAKAIWQVPAAHGYMLGSYNTIISMDEAVAEQEDFAAQQEGEIWAENAWLRTAEAGTPDTWREEELERMAAASGVPIPPGYF